MIECGRSKWTFTTDFAVKGGAFRIWNDFLVTWSLSYVQLLNRV